MVDCSQILRFNVTGMFTRSKFQGESDALDGGSVSGVIAPALRLAEDTAIAMVYYGSYNRELQVFTEDEGPRQIVGAQVSGDGLPARSRAAAIIDLLHGQANSR